ncbi:fructose bisphosphate aldolase [Nitratidesulfovibrio termitidis]|uniref:fructose bisphosphate aldolase n=1 Tax=Nitratidesulfovibrio termitidis TaxID=42252 RepID=UPI00040BA2FA|nr:fructose bisphosphate aldolase [Nitratidesulfovibrio termitidis]
MNEQQFDRIRNGKGFIAALDQSGGSTPKALRLYGIGEDRYASDAEMLALVHAMRTRIMRSPSFGAQWILGAILFEDTLYRAVDGSPTADYLWEKKGVAPFLKVDKGLAEPRDGVQLMRPIGNLEALLREAAARNVFGTKMRSVIKEADERGIADVVEQQFDVAGTIMAHGLVPIIEPEVDIHSPVQHECEVILLREVRRQLARLPSEARVMFKFSLPARDDFYRELMDDPHVVRIVALSGGYSRDEANARLARNHGLIASFSRALTEGLDDRQSDAEFDAALAHAVRSIHEASLT